PSSVMKSRRFTMAPVLPTERIAHSARHETAALRDFDPAYDHQCSQRLRRKILGMNVADTQHAGGIRWLYASCRRLVEHDEPALHARVASGEEESFMLDALRDARAAAP